MKTLSSNADLAALRQRITLVSPTDSALWGSMSVHQMLCHLTDTLTLPLSGRTASPLKISRLPRPILKWFALNFPRKWPAGVPTLPEIDQQRGGGTPPADFSADRATLLAALDRFAATTAALPPHPIFGTLTRKEWMRWGYLHTDHHLRQFSR